MGLEEEIECWNCNKPFNKCVCTEEEKEQQSREQDELHDYMNR